MIKYQVFIFSYNNNNNNNNDNNNNNNNKSLFHKINTYPMLQNCECKKQATVHEITIIF